MSGAAVYPTCPIKRHRSTKVEVWARRQALYDIVLNMKPMTVRQVFYQATVRGLVEKAKSGYGKVQGDLMLLRSTGVMPYGWLTDNTRLHLRPPTFGSIQEALKDTAAFYRKSLWRDLGAYCEVWIEKDALSSVVYPVTANYDVPLMVARGFSSATFLHNSAEYLEQLTVPAFIYHLGDYDPSGVCAANTIERQMREMAPSAEIHFKRLAVTPEQIDQWNLPTRPTKKSDSRSKGFGDISVELDAIDPSVLRALVQDAIEDHLPADQLAVLRVAENSEREMLKAFVQTLPVSVGGIAR